MQQWNTEYETQWVRNKDFASRSQHLSRPVAVPEGRDLLVKG